MAFLHQLTKVNRRGGGGLNKNIEYFAIFGGGKMVIPIKLTPSSILRTNDENRLSRIESNLRKQAKP